MSQTASAERSTGQLDHLSDSQFRRLAKFIEDYAGIKMPATKKTMLEGRLRKRVAAAGCANLADYCNYLFERNGLELETLSLIDVVTTNKTEFFREPEHFRYLAEKAVPELAPWKRPGRGAVLKVWSAASSTGAEAYTLAMVLTDLAARTAPFEISILGTDISTRVLRTAALGIYPEAMATPIPAPMRQRYLLRSKTPGQGLVRVVPELRRLVQFQRLNLMDDSYPMGRDFDVIFVRNVLIYFDKPTQNGVLERLCDHLVPGGYLVLGHSESLAGQSVPLRPVAPTVFRRL
ncbi:CheR family methyltransferase [Paracraurococcus lichenis]|uniref:Chemotaxis protein methyltransferase n=1 Tax=Paracraurococcus lichenis TaxID=3064888 RepID=A0ABT9E441_9PROT|nr:protein-glutamate O-methyltransferase [Paracraurococcus sp. LOR1-02]MDO9710926.1 protein-glutamate O-methyltransferase [Paracraurococcus sp. LOR1-02]